MVFATCSNAIQEDAGYILYCLTRQAFIVLGNLKSIHVSVHTGNDSEI